MKCMVLIHLSIISTAQIFILKLTKKMISEEKDQAKKREQIYLSFLDDADDDDDLSEEE